MNCTSCSQGILKPASFEEGLPAHSCSNCNGHWVLINDFISWIERYPDYNLANDASYHAKAVDSKKALICPASGNIMTKYQISSSSEHRLDYSASVGGIWLDTGEWELLKSEGLAGTLHTLVTNEWQQQIREHKAENNFSQMYSDKFGKDVYIKVKEFREWLENQAHNEELKAYITAENPYSAEQ